MKKFCHFVINFPKMCAYFIYILYISLYLLFMFEYIFIYISLSLYFYMYVHISILYMTRVNIYIFSLIYVYIYLLCVYVSVQASNYATQKQKDSSYQGVDESKVCKLTLAWWNSFSKISFSWRCFFICHLLVMLYSPCFLLFFSLTLSLCISPSPLCSFHYFLIV